MRKIRLENYVEKVFGKEIFNEFIIIRYIFNHASGANINQLIKITKLDRRMVYKYTAQINDYFKARYNREIIHFSKKIKYIFKGDKLDYQKIIIELAESSPMFNLIRGFAGHNSVNLQTFLSENYIGEDTLRRQIRAFNEITEKFDIRFIIRKGNVYLTGAEPQIRYFLLSFLWRIYRGAAWPFQSIDESKIDQLLKVILSDYDSRVPTAKKKELSYLLALNITRFTSKNLIIESDLPDYATTLNSIIDFKVVGDYLKANFLLTDVEINFLFIQFQSAPEYFIYLRTAQTSLDLLKVESSESYQLITEFIEFVKKRHPEFDVNSSDGQDLLSSLLAGKIFMDLFKSTYFTIASLNLNLYIKMNFPSLIPVIHQVIDRILPNLDNPLKESLTLRYVQAYAMVFPPHDFEETIYIKLETDMPIYVEKLTKLKIGNLLSPMFNIKLTTWLEETPSCDLIISTGAIDPSIGNIKQIYINAEVSEKDRNNIIKICTTILKEKVDLKKKI